jgi:hypothetical protein
VVDITLPVGTHHKLVVVRGCKASGLVHRDVSPHVVATPLAGPYCGDTVLEHEVDLLESGVSSASASTHVKPLHSGMKKYAQIVASVAIGPKMNPTFMPRLA